MSTSITVGGLFAIVVVLLFFNYSLLLFVYFPVECISLSLAMTYTPNSVAGMRLQVGEHVLPHCGTLAVFFFLLRCHMLTCSLD